jgi:glycosyltransferase involved in cell wall biosynthesis
MLKFVNMQEKDGKIKVLMAITKGFWGGAQEYVFSLATGLPSEKYAVTVLCGEGENLPEKLAEKNIRVLRIETISRDISFFTEFKNLFELIKILRKEKPDVLHLNSSKIGGLGALAGKMAGVPKIIFTGHGWAFNESRPWISRKFFLFLHWLTIILSDTTIAVSQKTKNDLGKLPFVKNKIFVVHNGISPIDFFEKQTAREKLIEMSRSDLDIGDSDKIWIGTISELHKNKGLDFLISACQSLPENVSIFIIGEGEERKNLENQITKLGLQNKIHLLGRVENARKYLKAFDIFTLTSRTEALPYTILEAGLAGLPVVASRVGGIPEIIENNENGILVSPGNISEISNALNFLIAKKEKLKSFGLHINQIIATKFSINKMITETEKFYELEK